MQVPNIYDVRVQTDSDETTVRIELDDGTEMPNDENAASTIIRVGDDLVFGTDGWIEVQPTARFTPTVHDTIQVADDSAYDSEFVALSMVIPLVLEHDTVDELADDGILGEAIADQLRRTAENRRRLEADIEASESV